MYCSSCGVAVTPGLSYCNRCGAKQIRGDGTKASELRPETLVFGMLATFVFGIIAITILMGVSKNVLDVPIEGVLALGLIPFLLMIVLEVVFIRLLLRRNSDVGESRKGAQREQHATNELDGGQQRALPHARQSVTEHTTRTFEPIYHDRKSE